MLSALLEFIFRNTNIPVQYILIRSVKGHALSCTKDGHESITGNGKKSHSEPIVSRQ